MAVTAELASLAELQPASDAVVRLQHAELLEALAVHGAVLALSMGWGITPRRTTQDL